MMEETQKKIFFIGQINFVQVRSTVWRYVLDNRTHAETGYNTFLKGTVKDADDPQAEQGEVTDFSVAISDKQMQKMQFCIGDVIQGTAWTKKNPKWEYADYYRAGSLKKIQNGETLPDGGPPWRTEVPDLETYAWRGARMLDTRCYKGKCFQCRWAAIR